MIPNAEVISRPRESRKSPPILLAFWSWRVVKGVVKGVSYIMLLRRNHQRRQSDYES